MSFEMSFSKTLKLFVIKPCCAGYNLYVFYVIFFLQRSVLLHIDTAYNGAYVDRIVYIISFVINLSEDGSSNRKCYVETCVTTQLLCVYTFRAQ